MIILAIRLADGPTSIADAERYLEAHSIKGDVASLSADPIVAPPDTPAKWAARQLREGARYIAEDGAYGWVHRHLVNEAVILEALDEKFERDNAADKDEACGNIGSTGT